MGLFRPLIVKTNPYFLAKQNWGKPRKKRDESRIVQSGVMDLIWKKRHKNPQLLNFDYLKHEF